MLLLLEADGSLRHLWGLNASTWRIRALNHAPFETHLCRRQFPLPSDAETRQRTPSSSGYESLFWSYVQGTLATWDPGYGISVDTNVKCVPPAETTWWDQNRLGVNSLTTLSLGPITCPSAWTTVTTVIES
ncbi:hypothetical protein NA56DRAFT_170905 [Hyaloscypha hepaticicola]|uniref:Uncharacterized protein n=1 Tax=Hyaloscypha hepaticicola TaxID=2082293 RepID=A0A2J6Q2X6_9HELO|nr:hypothetical protein NA56DRAFT_170905 [Hyaloscypha hepaticicola]